MSFEEKKYKAVISIQLEYEILATDTEEVIAELENVLLPHRYVEDSFEIEKIEEIKDD